MPVIQGTKKGKAKMKGSNMQKCSAGKKGGKGAEITTSRESGGWPSPLFRVAEERLIPEPGWGHQAAPGALRAVAFPRSSSPGRDGERCSSPRPGTWSSVCLHTGFISSQPPQPAAEKLNTQVSEAEILLLL